MWDNITFQTSQWFDQEFENIAKKCNSEDELFSKIIQLVSDEVFEYKEESNLNSYIWDLIEFAIDSIDFRELASTFWENEENRRKGVLDE